MAVMTHDAAEAKLSELLLSSLFYNRAMEFLNLV